MFEQFLNQKMNARTMPHYFNDCASVSCKEMSARNEHVARPPQGESQTLWLLFLHTVILLTINESLDSFCSTV